MELKNKSFTIFGEKWTIQFVDKLDVAPDAPPGSFRFGETNIVLHHIKVAAKDSLGKPFPKAVMEVTLAHELVHAMLDSGQYNYSSTDEPMVEWLGKCIVSLIKQKIL